MLTGISSFLFRSHDQIALATGLERKVAAQSTPASWIQVTNTLNSGPGSLRQAILDSNAFPGDDILEVGVTGVISLASALPSMVGNASILGPGAEDLTVSGSNSVRILTVESGGTLTGSGLCLADGVAAVYDDGGDIMNAGWLAVSNSSIRNCRTAAGFGGAIFNSGSLVLIGSTVCSNGSVGQAEGSVSRDGPGAGGAGAGLGGGLYCQSGSVGTTNCTFSQNQAVGERDGNIGSGWIIVRWNHEMVGSSFGGSGGGPVGGFGGSPYSDLNCGPGGFGSRGG